MTLRTAIPSLFVIPDKTQSDYAALYALAKSYAESGLLISAHGKEIDSPVFSFSAVTCSCLALELFLKFFLMIERIEAGNSFTANENKDLPYRLWEKISPARQALIAGVCFNNTEIQSTTSSEQNIQLFTEKIQALGEAPFDKWRYANELKDAALMSHEKIDEIIQALDLSASSLIQEKSTSSQFELSTSNTTNVTDLLTQIENDEQSPSWESNDVLLRHDSALKRIPANIEPKQALFLDGIRHSVEILDVTYARLRENLTQLALKPPKTEEIPNIFTHAFLDAWCFEVS